MDTWTLRVTEIPEHRSLQGCICSCGFVGTEDPGGFRGTGVQGCRGLGFRGLGFRVSRLEALNFKA